MKNRIEGLAKKAIDFQVDFPYSPMYLLRYFEWLTPYYSFLYLICRETRPKLMVELGTNCGMGAIRMALGNPEGKVVTIDPDETSRLRMEGYGFNFSNIEIYTEELIGSYTKFEDGEIDLLFIDGDHEYNSVMEYYLKYFPKVKSNGVILIDDIQLSEDMEKFWNDISHSKFDLNFIRPKDPTHPGRGVGFGVVIKDGRINESK